MVNADLRTALLVHQDQFNPPVMSSFTHPRIEADADLQHGLEEFSYEPLPADPTVFGALLRAHDERPLPVIELE